MQWICTIKLDAMPHTLSQVTCSPHHQHPPPQPVRNKASSKCFIHWAGVKPSKQLTLSCEDLVLSPAVFNFYFLCLRQKRCLILKSEGKLIYPEMINPHGSLHGSPYHLPAQHMKWFFRSRYIILEIM